MATFRLKLDDITVVGTTSNAGGIEWTYGRVPVHYTEAGSTNAYTGLVEAMRGYKRPKRGRR